MPEYYTDRQDRSDIDDEHFEADLLASAMADIRRRFSATNYAIASAMTASSADVPRLLAALGAVLALTEVWTDIAAVIDPSDAADTIRAAISHALIGQNGGQPA